MTAEIESEDESSEAVILTLASRFSGWGMGKPVFHHNHGGVERYSLQGNQKLAPGMHNLEFDFKYAGGGARKEGAATLSVDGKQVDSTEFLRTTGYRMSLDETLGCGEDIGYPSQRRL